MQGDESTAVKATNAEALNWKSAGCRLTVTERQRSCNVMGKSQLLLSCELRRRQPTSKQLCQL